MRASICFIAACCAIPLAIAEALPDYTNWFQVELIVFKPGDRQFGDVVRSGESQSYPHDLVSVGPVSDDDLAPDTLEQLAVLLQQGATLPMETSEVEQDKPHTFLFADQSREQLYRELLDEDSAGNRQEVDGEVTAETNLDDIFNSGLPDAFRQLHRNQLSLQQIAASLRRSPGYDLLTHRGWLQPLSSDATQVLLQTGDRHDELFEIDGTLSISKNRFPLVYTDLWFTEFNPNDNQQQVQSPGNSLENVFPDIDPDILAQYPELVEQARERGRYVPVNRYRLQHSRKMRTNELHFIDHPSFGILIRIAPFQNPLDDSSQPGE